MKRLILATLGSALIAGTTALPVAAQEKFINIGTGGQTGVYYAVGQSICRLVNRNTGDHGIRCTAPSTGGSVANLNAIRAGEQEMGVAQSDQQFNALNGVGPFEAQGPFEELRAVFAVHPEPFTVLARADSGVATFDDLKGKRVNIGNPGSGQRATMDLLMEMRGWSRGDFALASELGAAEQAQALCDNRVDAIVYVVGHPNGSIQEATTSCETLIVPVTGDDIDQLIADHPYYAKATIPGEMYTGNPGDIETFGVAATFVSSTNVDEETIYQVVKAVFDNFDRFKQLHPAFGHLTPESMMKNGLSAPLHAGSERYFTEQGWM
jgi:uncharacterized protein